MTTSVWATVWEYFYYKEYKPMGRGCSTGLMSLITQLHHMMAVAIHR